MHMNVSFIRKPRVVLNVVCCLLLFAACRVFSSCSRLDVYEKNTIIPRNEWQSAFAVKGNFDITDTLTPCNIYIVLRHTDAYQYNNIWLNIGLQLPGDTMRYQKVNLLLGNDATGWEGTGMNDIWEVRKLLNTQPLPFRKTGQYNYRIEQIMRDNPLPHIMSVGMRIEKLERN
jgi:gliding motility-associated lipoprotein GldH